MTDLPGHDNGPTISAKDWTPRGIDTKTPSVARMYDYYLGGKHHYPVDREAAEQVLTAFPELPSIARANRAFLVRMVRFMTQAGIRQFLDLGTGLPTQENVHQVAQASRPDAHVVYVDNDPVTLAHGRALLANDDHTIVADADLRHPEQVLTHPEVTGLLDFNEPLAVLFIAVLHFVTQEEDAAGIVAAFRDALPSGSYIGMSIANADVVDPEQRRQHEELYRSTTSQFVFRTRAQIQDLLEGFDLVEPGLVAIPDWRPDSAEQARVERAEAPTVGLAAVGRKP